MSIENTKEKNFDDILKKFDSSKKFYPENFDFKKEDGRASSLANHLEMAMKKVKAYVEDYSLNQDGSRFLIVKLSDKSSLADVAKVSISSFGRLATIEDALLKDQELIIDCILSEGYVYIPMEYLERSYDGDYSEFKGESWYYRYFTPWYKAASD